MGYQDLFAKKHTAQNDQKASVQHESDLKNPATGFGISVKEAAFRLSTDEATIERMIAEGKFESAFQDVDKTGENEQYWVSGVEVSRLMGSPFRYTDADLH